MATSASEWRKKREAGIEIEFPDYGDVVAIRPMDETFFFKQGMIPDFLAPAVEELIASGEMQMPKPDKTEKWLTWLDELVKWAFVSPKVVDAPHGDDEISIDEVSYADKVFLYGLFGRPAYTLRQFRDKQKQLVSALDAAKNNGHSTKQAAERSKVGE